MGENGGFRHFGKGRWLPAGQLVLIDQRCTDAFAEIRSVEHPVDDAEFHVQAVFKAGQRTGVPQSRQRDHYRLDERPTEPVQADWMLAAFLLLRREMLEELGGFDEGYRLYGEDIDLCYRAAQAGWERWYVPQAIVQHAHAAVTDRRFLTRQTLWHWRSIARFVRKHPERLRNI